MTEQQAELVPSELFSDRALDAFDAGRSVQLLEHRNRQLGQLLLAERALFYVQILYRLLLFRRDHELEPLYDDIFEAVREAQEGLLHDSEYGAEQFRADIDQLFAWDLLTCRIEIERLRGYRDSRKKKFRYSLTEECVAFLEWLEERCQCELERPDDDARDLLEEVKGSLRELMRVLGRFDSRKRQDGDARRILYQLLKLDDLGLAINGHLGTFNARLLTFVVRRYEVSEARRVLRELEDFVEHFLQQIHELRGQIVEQVTRLLQERNQERIRVAVHLLDTERRRIPQVLRRPRECQNAGRIPVQLHDFFRQGGKLDSLCLRVHASALKVWRKLHSHLRELERRNNRVEDLRDRIAELAALPADCVPHRFLGELLGYAGMRNDPNYWDDYEKADPPQPRRRVQRTGNAPPTYLPRKRRRQGPVVSMEQARLEKLRDWLEGTLGQVAGDRGTLLSSGAYTEAEDFQRIMELSKAALLAGGQRLHRVHYHAQCVQDTAAVTVSLEAQSLRFRDLALQRLPGSGPRRPEPGSRSR